MNEHALLPHAIQRLPDWIGAWRPASLLVLLLDFDGTLAPIVDRPELAAPLPAARAALDRLLARDDVAVAVVSGRGLADARRLLGIADIAYAGNHGMEIEGPGVRDEHEEAAAARPALERILKRVRLALQHVEGALVEDKGLTLSIHYRLVAEAGVPEVRAAAHAAAAAEAGVRLTEGKKVVEVRPDVDWHKGRAVDFLLDHLRPPVGAPVLYIGDDTTDEDAFRALRERGAFAEGILVADPPPAARETAAKAFLRNPAEVARLLTLFADAPA